MGVKATAKSNSKIRADVLLVERGLAESRERAQALIMAGVVFTPAGRVAKAGSLLASDVEVEVQGRLPYVSRGGYKLAHALDEFGLDPSGLVALDVGASTGGFTDCLLQRGPPASMPSMWDTASLPTLCDRTIESSATKR